MKEYVIDLDKWDRVERKYVYPLTPNKSNWYLHGFVAKNDYTIDLYNWCGFTFETEINGVEEIEVKVETIEFREARNLEIPDVFTWKTKVAGDGMTKITAKLRDFDLFMCEPAKWKYVRSVSVNKEVYNLKAIRGEAVCAHSEIMSKPGSPGEVISYEIELLNCTDKIQAVGIHIKKKGWETLDVSLSDNCVVIEPYGRGKCILNVKMNERVVPGGFEKQMIEFIPNGTGAGETLEFYTVRSMTHPYIIHNSEGWQKVNDKTEKYTWAAKLKDRYIHEAEEWVIPQTDTQKPYLYVTDNAHQCYKSALVWTLTGDIKFAEKSAEFLRSVANEETGYPATLRACNQQMVHEGEFFKSCAFAYDLIYKSGTLSSDDKSAIERTFRMFAWRIDYEISGGGISNWSLAMIAGAMYCSMCLQDRSLIERFVYGTGGITEHMAAGILPDGWWCECSIGYSMLVAGFMSEYSNALAPWGINLRDLWVPAQYSDRVQPRTQHVDGLSWDIYGGNTKNYRRIKDLWDSLISMVDYRGVVIGTNDGAESKFAGNSDNGLDARYDIAYAQYQEPAYARLIKNGGEENRSLIYGVGELPDVETDVYKKSYHFDNGGVSMLRTNTEGRNDFEQYQASLKYGSHGGAHGHYDRCAMNSLVRYGKSFYNPESVWYSYGTFMYKFFVQCSITHNMVTVDLKQQDPALGKNIMFYSGKMMQANAVETTAKWSNPPYGGWRVLLGEEFKDRIWNEGRYIPIPENAPEYTSRTDFTEPIIQRRFMILTDDFAVNFDYIEGEREHQFDCIYHARGFRKVSGVTTKKWSEQLTTNPLSSAQLITDCMWYQSNSDTAKAEFMQIFTEEDALRPKWKSDNRTGYNIPGDLGIDIYYTDAKDDEIIIGGDPVYQFVNKRLTYKVETDGECAASGAFGAWILGRDSVSVDLTNKSELRLRVKVEKAYTETDVISDYEKTIFWGDPYIITGKGEKIYLSQLEYKSENADCGNGIGVDYFGGPVTIQAKKFDKAIPSEPIDNSCEAIISIDLSGLDAVKFEAEIGGDYPLGDGCDRRKFITHRKTGKSARYASIIELHEGTPVIKTVKSLSENAVMVELNNGICREVRIEGLETGRNITAEVIDYKNGKVIRREKGE